MPPEDDKKPESHGNRRWFLGKMAAGAGAAALAGGTAAYVTNREPPAPVSASPQNATDFAALLQQNGQAVPMSLQIIVALEAQLQITPNQDEQQALRTHIRFEQYAAMRAGTLPADYQNFVLDQITPEYEKLSARAESARRRADLHDHIGDVLDKVEQRTSIPMPDHSGVEQRSEYNDLLDEKKLPERLMIAGGRLPADPSYLSYIDREMTANRAVNQQRLDTYSVIAAINNMAQSGLLTVTADNKILAGLKARSEDPRAYGTPHISLNQSLENRTKIIGAACVTAPDGATLDVVLPVGMLQPLSNALMGHNPTTIVADKTEAMRLEEVAKQIHKALIGKETGAQR